MIQAMGTGYFQGLHERWACGEGVLVINKIVTVLHSTPAHGCDKSVTHWSTLAVCSFSHANIACECTKITHFHGLFSRHTPGTVGSNVLGSSNSGFSTSTTTTSRRPDRTRVIASYPIQGLSGSLAGRWTCRWNRWSRTRYCLPGPTIGFFKIQI